MINVSYDGERLLNDLMGRSFRRLGYIDKVHISLAPVAGVRGRCSLVKKSVVTYINPANVCGLSTRVNPQYTDWYPEGIQLLQLFL